MAQLTWQAGAGPGLGRDIVGSLTNRSHVFPVSHGASQGAGPGRRVTAVMALALHSRSCGRVCRRRSLHGGEGAVAAAPGPPGGPTPRNALPTQLRAAGLARRGHLGAMC